MKTYQLGRFEIFPTNEKYRGEEEGYTSYETDALESKFHTEGWRFPTESEICYFCELADLGVGRIINRTRWESNFVPSKMVAARYWTNEFEIPDIDDDEDSNNFRKSIKISIGIDDKWAYEIEPYPVFDAFVRKTRSI